jgi:hypothetical protein
MPARGDFNPADVKDLLPRLTIVEPLEAGQYLIRLVGTEVADRMGLDGTGMHLHEAMAPVGPLYRQFIHHVYDLVLRVRRPVLSETPYGGSGWGLHLRRLSLPFSSDGGRVDRIISAIAFTWGREAAAQILSRDDRGDVFRHPPPDVQAAPAAPAEPPR